MIRNYPFHGLKGAVGAQLDQIHLFDGDIEKVQQLEAAETLINKENAHYLSFLLTTQFLMEAVNQDVRS